MDVSLPLRDIFLLWLDVSQSLREVGQGLRGMTRVGKGVWLGQRGVREPLRGGVRGRRAVGGRGGR